MAGVTDLRIGEQTIRVGNLLCAGRHGNVYKATDTLASNKNFVLKTDRRGEDGTLAKSFKFLNLLTEEGDDHKRFPIPIHMELHPNQQVMTMERMWVSLHYIHYRTLKRTAQPLHMDIVTKIGRQGIEMLEEMSNHGIVHGDIKPKHIMKERLRNNSPGMLRLVDFEHASEFRDSEGVHVKSKYSKRLGASMEFCSINVHMGRTLSRRDDIESLIYLIVFIAKGKLPWSELVARDPPPSHEEVLAMKKRINAEQFFENMPKEFLDLWSHFKSLSFSTEPDYMLMRNIMDESLVNNEPTVLPSRHVNRKLYWQLE